MKKYIIFKFVLSFVLFLLFVIMEIIALKTLDAKPLPTYWYIDICAFICICLISFILPWMLQVVLGNLFLLLHCILCLSNMIIYKSTFRVFDWSMVSLLDETANVIGMAVIPVFQTVIIGLLFIGYLILSIIFAIKLRGIYYKQLVRKLYYILSISILICVVVIEGCIPCVILNKYEENKYYTSDSFLYSTFENASGSLQMFGFWGYYFTALVRMIIPSWTPQLKFAFTWEGKEYVSDLKGLAKDDNVIFIMAESFEDYGISKATTPVLYALKNGANLSESGIENFYNVNIDNETGQKKLARKDFDAEGNYNELNLFEGLNFDDVGLNLVNYRSGESTNNSELRLLTSSVDGRLYENSLPIVLGNYGYVSNYIHGNYDSFYDRDSYMRNNLGFTNTIFYDEMSNDVESSGDLSFFLKDKDVVNFCLTSDKVPDIIPDEKFFTFMLTVSTHGEHVVNQNIAALMWEYLEKFDIYATSYKDDKIIQLYNSIDDEYLKYVVRCYLACVIDTEETISLLIDELYNEGRLEDTMFVFVSDHNAYSNGIWSFKEMYLKQVCGVENIAPADNNLIPAFIYSSKIKRSQLELMGYSRNIEHLTTSFDILPTILTLVDVDYNQDDYWGFPCIAKYSATGEFAYNKLGYNTTLGLFFNDVYLHISGNATDYDLITEPREYIDELHVYINEFYLRKYNFDLQRKNNKR